MAITIDPEGREITALRRVADWRGADVVEIGCGDGRLTRRLARLGARVSALDPNAAAIALAREKLPASYRDRVRFSVGSAESSKAKDGAFDIAVFAWSL